MPHFLTCIVRQVESDHEIGVTQVFGADDRDLQATVEHGLLINWQANLLVENFKKKWFFTAFRGGLNNRDQEFWTLFKLSCLLIIVKLFCSSSPGLAIDSLSLGKIDWHFELEEEIDKFDWKFNVTKIISDSDTLFVLRCLTWLLWLYKWPHPHEKLN